MDIIPDQIKESPALWEFFGWWNTVYLFLIIIAGLSLVAIVGVIAKRFGGDSADFFFLGLKFPPGHWAHRSFFMIMDILRLYAIIILIGAFIFNLDWGNIRNNDWWNFFVMTLMPTMLSVAVLYTLVDFLKMVWIGGPEEWKRYMDAYGVDVSDEGPYLPEINNDLQKL